MAKICLQGVVQNGQVVIDPALDLPDGTVVTVMGYDPDDLQPTEPPVRLTGEILAELAKYWRKEKSWEEAQNRIRQLETDL